MRKKAFHAGLCESDYYNNDDGGVDSDSDIDDNDDDEGDVDVIEDRISERQHRSRNNASLTSK